MAIQQSPHRNKGFSSLSFNKTPLTFGRLIETIFRTILSNFWPLAWLLLKISAPVLFLGSVGVAWAFFKDTTNGPFSEILMNVFSIGWGVLFGLSFAVTQGAFIHSIVNQMQDRPVASNEAIRKGMATLLPVLMTTLALLVIVVAGFFALVLPGILLMTMFFLAIPVAVVEDRGVMGNLRRSAELTSGFRWHIVGSIFVLAVAQNIFTSVLFLVAFLFVFVAGPLGLVILMVVYPLSFLLALLAQSALFAVVYALLRQEKDGTDLSEILSVFS